MSNNARIINHENVNGVNLSLKVESRCKSPNSQRFTISYKNKEKESVLVIPSVGVQSSVKYVFGREDYFVPWACIDDVIINEVIKLNRVLYFLTLIVKTGSAAGQDTESIKLIPLFKYTKPRLLMLETIYTELQELLTVSTKQAD